MLFTEKLVRDEEVVVKSIEEGINLLNTDFLVQRHECDLRDAELHEDGKFFWDQTAYPITDWAFESLCALLKMPKGFARSIPVELLIQNFNRLKHEHNQRIKIFISRGIVINLVSVPYIPARNEDILFGLQDIIERITLELSEIRICDRGMAVSLLKEESQNVEPKAGDITRFGLVIQNSETGYRGAKASFYLFRLICSNGATLTNKWGKVEWSYDNRISYERSLRNFFEGIINLNVDFARLIASYKGLLRCELKSADYINIWRRLARIVGSEEADRITAISKDERNHINREVRAGNRTFPTGINLYELYNSITEAARRFPFIQRRNMEILGGSLIDIADGNE